MKILITGDTSGIGKYLRIKYEKEGHEVWGISSRPINKTDKNRYRIDFLEFVNNSCVDYLYKNINCFIDATKCKNSFDLIINNAGILKFDNDIDEDLLLIEDIFAVNVFAPFMFMHNAKVLLKERGNIINISSSSSIVTEEGLYCYSVTKQCLNTFTQMFARKLGPDIRVNAILPGLVRFTNLVPKDEHTEEIEMGIIKEMPTKKSVDKRSIKQAIDFIVSCEDMTGSLLELDGGFSA